MTKFNRNVDGFIPSHVLLDAALRNPNALHLTKSLAATQALWAGSGARTNQLFRFGPGAGTGARFIYDAKNGTSRPGTLARKEGDAATKDATVNDGYDFHGIVREYYRIVHGRNSIDGNGMPVKGIVHFDKDYDNAYWDGEYMTYGDGDHTLFRTFMLLNVAAHELGHGVTEYAVPGGVNYYGMAGANNEHLSDGSGANVESWFMNLVFLVKQYLNSHNLSVPATDVHSWFQNMSADVKQGLLALSGVPMEPWLGELACVVSAVPSDLNPTGPVTALSYHWLVGKGIWAPSSDPKAVRRALRDMLNPGTAYNDPKLGRDRQPADMAHYVKTSSDNGGVHTNSSIPNRMYALFARGIEEKGLGKDWDSTIGKAGRVWYAARPNLGNNPSFGQLAVWALEACGTVFPNEADALRAALKEACKTVGVVPNKTAIDDLTPVADNSGSGDSIETE